MNERWLLFLVAAGAIAAPRLGAWLARPADDDSSWIVLVNDSPEPIVLDLVSRRVLAIDGGGRTIAPGRCARVERIDDAREDIAIAWLIAGRPLRELVTVDPGDATFTLDTDARPRAALPAADVESCPRFWMATCTKGLELPPPE